MYGHDECDQRVKSTVRLGNSLKHAAHQVCCYLNFASDPDSYRLKHLTYTILYRYPNHVTVTHVL